MVIFATQLLLRRQIGIQLSPTSHRAICVSCAPIFSLRLFFRFPRIVSQTKATTQPGLRRSGSLIPEDRSYESVPTRVVMTRDTRSPGSVSARGRLTSLPIRIFPAMPAGRYPLGPLFP